jgi:UDP-3-O-[3-hydroxymyristoyl] glucosamine N-acyltransferase
MITAPEQLGVASDSEITLIGNKKYEKLWSSSKAFAVVNKDISIEPGDNRAFIKVKMQI